MTIGWGANGIGFLCLNDFITVHDHRCGGVGGFLWVCCRIYFLGTRLLGGEPTGSVSFVGGFPRAHDLWALRGRGGFYMSEESIC